MRPSVRRVEEAYGDRVDFHILNIDEYSTNYLAEKYQVRGIPMIVLLDAQGKLVTTLFGYQEEAQLVAAIKALLVPEP